MLNPNSPYPKLCRDKGSASFLQKRTDITMIHSWIVVVIELLLAKLECECFTLLNT